MIDTKPRKRIVDKELLHQLHLIWHECALCGATYPLSLHHISKHPRDDVRGNLCMLCGSGTTGCHGLIEAHYEDAVRDLGKYILRARGDTISYLYQYHGAVSAQEWMRRNLLV